LRKPLIGALVGVCAFGIIVAGAAAELQQTADISFTKPKAGASTGTKSNLTASDTDPSVQQPLAASKVVVNFPTGTKFNYKAGPPVCTASDGEIQSTNGAVCSKSKVGSGLAQANVKPLLQTDVALDITAFNGKNKLIFYLVPRGGVGNPLVLKGALKGNKLTTPVPRIEAVGGSGVFAVLTSFNLVTKAYSKKGDFFATAPKTCPGKWTTKTNFTYIDGSAKTVTSTQPCKK
jgi:hypothetical protein